MQRVLIGLAVLLCGFVGLWKMSSATSFQPIGEMITRGPVDRPRVALTFDDGPTRHALEVLDTLDRHGVRATFFVIGREMNANRDVTRAILERGHELANHSFHHERMIFRRPSWVRQQIEVTDALIEHSGQKGQAWFRPPYGKRLFVLPYVLEQMDRPVVLWDVAPDSNVEATRDEIVDKTLAEAKPGSIILLHPMYDSRKETRAALDSIIVGLRAKGLEPGTVSSLLPARSTGPGGVTRLAR